MKRKSLLKLGGIGSIATAIAVGFALAMSASGNINAFRTHATDHDANCHWNHYSEVAATYASHGSKEFWACCTHPGNFVLSEPAEGHISDVGAFSGEAFENLDSVDARYLPELEGGNKYASLDIIGWQDKALLYTKAVYENIESVTFKMRIDADTDEMSSIWFAIGVANDQGDWSGLDNNFFTKVVDGEWHLYTRKMNGQSGYIKLCYNMDHVIAGSIDVDDFRIETSSGAVVETFDEDSCLFGLDASHARLGGEQKQNNFARLTVNPIYDDDALLYTFAQYASVTEVSFRLRVNGSTVKSWEGAAVNTSAYGDDQYTGMNANESYEIDGDWHYRTFAFSSVTGYVNLINEIGHLACDSLDIDDIAIVYDGGKVAYETFDDGLVLFGTPAQLQRVMIKSEAPEASYGPLALDLIRGTLESREYSPTFDLSKGVDATYGPYIQIDNWQCNSGQNRSWLGFKSEALPESQTRLQLGGAEIKNYFFFMYNPLDNALDIKLQFEHHYTDIATVSLASKAWTKISVNHGAWGSYQCTNPTQIGFDRWCSSNGELVGSGFKVTSVYAEPVAPSPAVDPAPFGVVALDAQTGYFRDIKGYNPPHTDSHGIDATYGAYIQVDDWACPAGANQCWITFSDTARDVADIETDLGSSITNYFFYIYNPLAEDFTFKIMLKSSSGMNPNMTVNCVSGQWTKVTVAYGQADNGSYPALTSASQLGLTQVLGNGVAVGSGWKITSVYAE